MTYIALVNALAMLATVAAITRLVVARAVPLVLTATPGVRDRPRRAALTHPTRDPHRAGPSPMPEEGS